MVVDLDWNEICKLSIMLTGEVKDFTPDLVIAIERSGVFLAGVISKRLGVDFYSLRAKGYEGNKMLDPVF